MFGRIKESLEASAQLILSGRPLAPWERLRIFEITQISLGERKNSKYRWNVRNYKIVWTFITMITPAFAEQIPGGNSIKIQEAIALLAQNYNLHRNSIKRILHREIPRQLVRTIWVLNNAERERSYLPD